VSAKLGHWSLIVLVGTGSPEGMLTGDHHRGPNIVKKLNSEGLTVNARDTSK
jgi:hypothetical protein